MNELSKKSDAHPDFYFPATAYKPGTQYSDLISQKLPKTWRLSRSHFWTKVISPHSKLPVQGWKIHVSAIPKSAIRILEKVSTVCLALDVEFKFAGDAILLKSLLRKNFSRQQAGKFITIYPPNQKIFEQLLDTLYPLLKDEQGPYILSDRQYRDANVLFYRYGGMQAFPQINLHGEQRQYILNERFEFIEDVRSPYFVLPQFVEDSLAKKPPAEPDGAATLDTAESKATAASKKKVLGGKYEILSVLKHSAAGGVYFAKNIETQVDAIIKEARPYIELSDNGVDAVDRLKKEFRMLRKLAGAELAPQAFELFEAWNHTFLAQEAIHGQTMRQYMAKTNKLVHATESTASMQQWFAGVLKMSIALIEKIILLHKRNIIFGDLSLNNIVVDPETLQIHLIDFEGAYEPGVDPDTNMYTLGFARKSRRQHSTVSFADDHFALGSVLLAMIVPNVTLMELKPDFDAVALKELQQDIGLPAAYAECIEHLHGDSPIDLPLC